MNQKEVLQEILFENKETAYGKEHGFSKMKDLKDYRVCVPVSEYQDEQSWIERICKGEEDVLTAYPLAAMLKTSGGTGFRKKIPLTRKALELYSDKIFKNVTQGITRGTCLFMSVFPTDLDRPMEYETILSVAYYRYLRENGYLDPEISVGGERLLFTTEIQDVMFVKVWSAFYEKRITTIHSIFLYDVLLFFHSIEVHGQTVLECMKKRKIPDEIKISDEIREYLVKNLIPEKERLEEVEEQLSKGSEAIGKRLWPNLELISGIGGKFFEARERLLRKYIGKIPLHYFAYVASECMMGIADRPECEEYRLFSEHGFYEFDPIAQESEIVSCEGVQIGRKYEIIVTNWSGLYRYRIGDIVEVTGWKDGMPVIRVCGRKNQAINLAGEKTTSEMLEDAVNLFSVRNGLYLYDYSVWSDHKALPGRYLFLIECGRPLTRDQITQYEKQMDWILRETNPEYDEIRELGLLAEPHIVPLQTGAHNRAQNQAKGARHSKPMLVYKEGEVFHYEEEEWIEREYKSESTGDFKRNV